ncbi:zinc transporter ZIP8-like [Centruroides sculpturatus]|uniref:zinc transporter ZIP8-like n=1 Tax=Centruroides sculpturatus TaxID=218467 RepID=UPI000C6DCF34|nr:zinc transporter ZIP8-like [Centruroides sculpturatus]
MKIVLLSSLMLLTINVIQCVSLNSLDDMELLTKLTIAKYYPEFLSNNNETGLFNLKDLQSVLDKLIFTLRNLDVHAEQMNCSLQDSNAKDICNRIMTSKCMSTKDLTSLLHETETTTITSAVTKLCPVLLFQLHEKSCRLQEKIESNKIRPSTAAVWGFGILFVTIISCCSLVGVVLLPLINKNAYQTVLMVFEGLAVGSLVSSAIFHLIPQVESHKKTGSLSWFVLKGLNANLDTKNSRQERKDSSPVVCTNITTVNGIISSLNDSNSNCTKGKNSLNEIISENDLWTDDQVKQLTSSSDQVHSSVHHHNHEITFVQGQDSAIGTVAWMIIFGDGLHNFIDGLSIGAAFSESILSGISISVAVLCEEFPHELGDFAVLLGAGMTMRQALMYNFISACTCYLGLVFGILLGDLAEGSHYIFAFAGGMFIYISLVGMMNELNDALDAAQNEGIKKTLKVFLLQNIGIIIGVIVLFVMARYSENINFDIGSENTTTEKLSEVLKAMGDDHYNMRVFYQM